MRPARQASCSPLKLRSPRSRRGRRRWPVCPAAWAAEWAEWGAWVVEWAEWEVWAVWTTTATISSFRVARCYFVCSKERHDGASGDKKVGLIGTQSSIHEVVGCETSDSDIEDLAN